MMNFFKRYTSNIIELMFIFNIGDFMKALTPTSFIHTGLIIRLLRQSEGFSIKDIIGEANKLKDNLKEAGYLVSSEGLFDLLYK